MFVDYTDNQKALRNVAAQFADIVELADALDADVEVLNIPGRGGGNAWDLLHERSADGTSL